MAYSILYPISSMDGLHDITRMVDVWGPSTYRKRSLSLSSLNASKHQGAAKLIAPYLSSAARTPRSDTVEDGALTPITMITRGISRLHIQIQPLRYPSLGFKNSIKVKYRSVATPIEKLSSYLSQLEWEPSKHQNVQPFLARDETKIGPDPHAMEPNHDGYGYGFSDFSSEDVDYPFPSKHYHSSISKPSSDSEWTSSGSSTLNSPAGGSPGLSPPSFPITATGSDVLIDSPKPPSPTGTPIITFGSEADFPFTFTSPYPYPLLTTSSIHGNPLAHSQYSSSENTDSPQYVPRSKRARELISSEKYCKVGKIKYLSWEESEKEAEEDEMRWKRWKEARSGWDTDVTNAVSRFSQDVELDLDDEFGRAKKMRKISYE
ncbi:hypothetical protein I203_102522 [Kwoniella mangroviensis CBS 8507]|uniref:uncharacterized protein n=1 Tax=Kwoniella mangroviensis CBS 8507 TaxID=1296122 RepID=UPI00080D07D5|nr:uncharacterized protein I203_06638 [Kwoniella mangroviensis CBS 8507]OCF64456.1 hypothetical protein I203_06638 [Kwoniella mangroviensis CBS 8507]